MLVGSDAVSFFSYLRRRGTEVKRLSAILRLSVRLSVCPHDRTKTTEIITKLATGIVHHESWLPFNFRSEGHKMQKIIPGNRVADVSLHSFECSPSS